MGERCQRFGSDIFEVRLLGKRFYCVRGKDAARTFYAPDRFTHDGVLPASALKLLQDKGSVATLDADAHRRRKVMFMSLATPGRLDEMARLAAREMRTAAEGWRTREEVRLHGGFRAVLCRAVCAWAGVPLDPISTQRLTRQIGAMIDNAGTVGPSNWAARMQRWGAESLLRRMVRDVRAGRRTPPERRRALHRLPSRRGRRVAPAPHRRDRDAEHPAPDGRDRPLHDVGRTCVAPTPGQQGLAGSR